MITPKRPVTSADVARHYDELDAFYRALWGEHVHHGLWVTGRESPEEAAHRLVECVAQAARLEPGAAVCDVGCGYGATARLLAARYGAQVTALTVSAHQHRYAEAQAVDGPAPTYLLQDWSHNTLPDASFDAVLFVESLAHMHDKRRALAEAYRVLRPGGRLVACTWLAAADAPRWAARWLLEPICREGQLPGLPTAEAYRAWLGACGFEALRFDHLSANVRRTWRVVIVRLLKALVRRPAYRRYLLDRARRNRRFVLTPLRLWIGFHTGAFRYGLFAARRPR